ncbi:gastrula zinc finger protein XlCGF26.1-like [Cheilinus undulatus]|uniref:gastrula zinc finger protein XlCGF26.1-like n=1 Tax=Cheilinus undulatus TaxID=241271 RepID=UPI001BD4F68B|nr:gastrula zinc finger protein XlCGF26.1-like [Cheilinus undulatus]
MSGFQGLSVFPEEVQQYLVSKEDVSPEQQKQSSSLNLKITEPPHIKEEPEEPWSSQEREQLQEPEEDEIIKFTFVPDDVKSEDEEKPLSSQLHQIQTEEMETGAGEEDCGGVEAARYFDPDRDLKPETEVKTDEPPDPETDYSNGWRKSAQHQLGLESVGNVTKERTKTDKKLYICSECGRRFTLKERLNSHMRIHREPRPFDCTECGEAFTQKDNLIEHIKIHTGKTQFSCLECGQIFNLVCALKDHLAIHRKEKVFSCPECGKIFKQKVCMTRHMKIHTRVKLCSCSKCVETCNQPVYLIQQIRIGMNKNSFRCSVCGKRFQLKYNLTGPTVRHTGEKPFSCCYCVERLKINPHWVFETAHSICAQSFNCSVCGQTFASLYKLRIHKCVCNQVSEPHKNKTEGKREEAKVANGEHCGGSGAARNLGPERHLQPEIDVSTDFSEPETEDTYYWQSTGEHQYCLPSEKL